MSRNVRCILLLTALTLVSYGHVCANDFIDLDDQDYVTENAHVRSGLTGESIHWAFTTTFTNFWQPLTWLSLQLDATLFGPDAAWGFHLTNLLFHLANVLLLFRLLAFMTAREGPSFWVAALFAVHPLHVESVAWVTERKDVLSTFFWLLATTAYAPYALSPSWKRMSLVVFLFTLGLMSKPMVVTLPFTLLLLDFWPLRRLPPVKDSRFATASVTRLLTEKIPLFLLAMLGSLLVFAIKRELDEVVSLSLGARLTNALTSYVWYLWKTLLPIGHGVYYSHLREHGHAIPALLSGLVLAIITLWSARSIGERPYLLVGWLWFLGTLIPVIGLVQVGDQARADRFVYVPHIGLFVALVWLCAALVDCFRWSSARVGVVGGTVILVLAALTWLQVRRWKNPNTLWEHTLAVTDGDPRAVMNLASLLSKKSEPEALERAYSVLNGYINKKDHSDFFKKREVVEAHFMAGVVLSKLQRIPEAIRHYEQALAVEPTHQDALNNLGHMLMLEGRLDEAIAQFELVLQLRHEAWETHLNLGAALMRKGELDRAEEHLRIAQNGESHQAAAQRNLGIVLVKRGQYAFAEKQFRLALESEPDHVTALHFLGLTLGRQGKWKEAIPPLREIAPQDRHFRCAYAYALFQSGDKEAAEEQYTRVTLLHPDWPSEFAASAFQNVTHPDPKRRDAQEAFEMATQACQATGFRNPRLLDVLAVTQAAKGDFSAAVKTAHDAILRAKGDADLTRQIEEHLRRYERKEPLPPREK